MLNSVREKYPTVYALLLPIFLSVCFLIYKIRMLNSALYKSDVYSFFQAANDWLIDKPVYFENTFGYIFQHHTYYLIPALAPFTKVFGISGLFIVQLILLLLCIRSLLLMVEPSYRMTRSIGLSILIFGPLGFYLWDDITYGWHIESLIFPLTLYAGSLLYRKKYIGSYIAFLFLTLIREDAILQVAAIISMLSLLDYFTYKKSLKDCLKRICFSYGVAVCIFFLNLFVLKLGKGDVRFGQSQNGFFLLLNSGSEGALYMWNLVKYFSLMVLSIPFFLFAFRPVKKKFYLIFIFVLPSLATGFIAGLFYFPQEAFSILWATRLFSSSSLVILGSLLIMGEFRMKLGDARVRLALLFFIQFYAFYMPSFNRYYNPFFNIQIASGKEISKEYTQSLNELKCIANAIPQRITIVTNVHWAYAFQNHDFILDDAFITSFHNQPTLAVLKNTDEFKRDTYFEPIDSISFTQIKVYFTQETLPFKQKLSHCDFTN